MSSPLEPEDYLTVDTPENVAFGYEVAGIGSRFLAALVDTFIILFVQLIVGLTSVFLAWFVLRDLVGEDIAALGPWLLGLFGLVGFALLWGYYIFFEMTWNGQSPGKRWAGLRVIRMDGTPLTLTESLVRNLVRLIDFLPAYYGVGVVTMFINSQSRRLGDLAAGTLVVRDRASVTLESLTAPAVAPRRALVPNTGLVPASPPSTDPVPPSLAAGLVGLWPIERLSEPDVAMAEDFLRRRGQLSGRAALARSILRALLRPMDVPEQSVPEAQVEDTLSAIVLAYRRRAAA